MSGTYSGDHARYVFGRLCLVHISTVNDTRSQGKWDKEAWIEFQVLYNPMVDCNHYFISFILLMPKTEAA
jgi:hypothetical protein